MKTKGLWITTLAALLLSAYLSGCKDENVAVVGVCPLVISTDPVNGASNIPAEQVITVTFNEAMDPATITPSAMSLQGVPIGGRGFAVVTGTLTYNGTSHAMTFTPSAKLTPKSVYTGTVATTVKDLMGNSLQAAFVWSFSTAATVSPTVTSTDPANAATGVVLNKAVTATFSVPMDPTTINATTFTVKLGATAVAGTVSYSGNTATFKPTSALTPNSVYTGTITKGAKNTLNATLASDYLWTFTTGALVAPSVSSVDPANQATSVPLNKVINATFSEAMDPLTITTSTFTLTSGGSLVAGAVTYTGTTASFTPSSNLISGTVYTGTLTTGAKNIAGTPIANNFNWTFTVGSITVPAVSSTDPANLAAGVALNKVINATFNMAMDPLTITASTFTVKAGATSVAGTIAYSGTTASFTPTANLVAGTNYTATITTGAKNVAGVALANDFVWTFATGAVTAPTVTATDPLNLEVNVASNKIITASFSVPMDGLTLTALTFTVKIGVTSIAGVVTYAGTTATFTPASPLPGGSTYTATITTGAKNVAGTSLANNYVWTFNTGAVIAPTVTSTDPANLVTGVALNKVISATFSQAMNPLTLTTLTFTVKLGATSVLGIVNYAGNTATFTPGSNLLSGNIYTATITTGAKNVGGVSLVNDHVWSFSTVAPLGPQVVNLNSVARFGIIAGVGVSNNAGPSVINNLDVGIYPGARTGITGFPPATIVNGASYAADDAAPVPAMLLQAQNDLTAAYIFARDAVSPAPASAPADLGGKTLAPGIWTSATSMLLQNGNLTLDAQGDVNAVWIFQIGSTLTSIGSGPFPSSSGGNVILAGGAQAKNVFWQVGASATLGDYTSFKGNILAFSSVTMNTGAVAEGRMLARNASVTMTSTNIINKP